MNGERHEEVGELEERLGELTRWKMDGARPRVWERAWVAVGEERPARSWGPFMGLLGRPLSPGLMTGIAAVLVMAVVVGLMLPSLGKARSSSRQVASRVDVPERAFVTVPAAASPPQAGMAPARAGRRGPAGAAETLSPTAGEDWNEVAKPAGITQGDLLAPIMKSFGGVTDDAQATGRLGPSDRAVVRRATIELLAPDVRSAFLKAQHALSEVDGEYVQESSLTGSGKSAQGSMTLRVSAARLGAVLNALRELGDVKSEQQAGEDVTTQMVDLEARLRNERRVEKELLELLDSRKNSPLKEILDLRSSLTGVRQSIEQLAGQQERLGRLVSLASVLVIIRTADAPVPDEVKKDGMWGYFAAAAGSAWVRGLTALADTLAVIVSIAIGGLVWWIVIGIAAAVIVRVRRRAAGKPGAA